MLKMTIKKIITLFLLFAFMVSLSLSCKENDKTAKNDNNTISSKINNMPTMVQSDTLYVPYTYWWENAGPFIGMCGDEYTLVFLGEVTHIGEATKKPDAKFTSQIGHIKIHKRLKPRDLTKGNPNMQMIFISNCFYGTDVKAGDKVLVFCYKYERAVAIPGPKSILKIDNYDAPVVKSIEKYIDAKQNPLVIKQDIPLWEKYGFGTELKQIIDCKEAN